MTTRSPVRLALLVLLVAAVVDAALVVLYTMPTLTHYLGTFAAIVAAIFGWAFVVLYARKPHDWRATGHGKHLMWVTTGMAVVFTYVSVFNILNPNVVRQPAMELLRLAIFAYFAVMLVWRLQLLRAAAREAD